MAKINKEDREKRRFLILQKLSDNKTIDQIWNELKCGKSTVFRLKKEYKNYLLKTNYDKEKAKERLTNVEGKWRRSTKIEEKDLLFHGFSLKDKKRTRKSSIPYEVKLYIYIKCKDKNTGGCNGVSIEKIRVLSNRKFKTKLSASSISRFLKKKFKRTYAIRKRPILTKNNIQKRKSFAKSIIEKEINQNSIFFTDEKRFLIHFMPNKQTNRIRLCKKQKEE